MRDQWLRARTTLSQLWWWLFRLQAWLTTYFSNRIAGQTTPSKPPARKLPMSTHLFSPWLYLIPTILIATQTWQGSCTVLYPLLSAHLVFLMAITRKEVHIWGFLCNVSVMFACHLTTKAGTSCNWYSLFIDHLWCANNSTIVLTLSLKVVILFYFILFLKNLFIHFQWEGKRSRKRGREISMCGCYSCTLYWGLRHVPWLGIEPVTLWFTAHAQSTELHQPGQSCDFKNN